MEFTVKKGAEAYRLDGNNGRAVLLIHGYTGTPGELRPLGDFLHGQGYTVLGVRLPGHGTEVADLENTTAEDWYAEAQRGARALLEQFDEVYMAGLSMGGLLALRVAASLPVKAAIIMSAPIFLPDKRLPLYPLLKYFIHYLPKSKKDYGEMMKYNLSYEVLPTKPLGSMLELMKECKKTYLKDIHCPTLVLQSVAEHTVEPRSAQYIYDHLGAAGEQKRLLWLKESGHIITLDVERKYVFQEVADFLRMCREIAM